MAYYTGRGVIFVESLAPYAAMGSVNGIETIKIEEKDYFQTRVEFNLRRTCAPLNYDRRVNIRYTF